MQTATHTDRDLAIEYIVTLVNTGVDNYTGNNRYININFDVDAISFELGVSDACVLTTILSFTDDGFYYYADTNTICIDMHYHS